MEQDVPCILIFELGGQRHGLPAADVQELLPALAMMPLSGAAPDVEGVINLRGVIVPVLDLRRRFGLAAKAMSLTDHFIVVRRNDTQLALHVDCAVELASPDAGAISRTMAVGGARSAWIANLSTGMVLLHDVEDFLAVTAQEATS